MSNSVRVRDGVRVSAYIHELGHSITLSQGERFDAGHPAVKEQGWAFVSDADRDAEEAAAVVEQATAAPGEKRAVKKKTAKKSAAAGPITSDSRPRAGGNA